MTRNRGAGLERSCQSSAHDWIRAGASRPGFERVQASFSSFAFAPHRHDTYAIGITHRGVQSFGYRGERRNSLAGHAFVLHPDELHDGRPGTAAGYAYGILYVEPKLIRDALGGASRPLPFVRDAVLSSGELRTSILEALEDWDVTVEDLRFDALVSRLAGAMVTLDRSVSIRSLNRVSTRAAATAREFLDANFANAISSWELERSTGLSRFALSRHFRACYGTSPHRYAVMRRLTRAKTLMRRGIELAHVAAECGFADQSHLTRHFKKTYGMTPGNWQALLLQPPDLRA